MKLCKHARTRNAVWRTLTGPHFLLLGQLLSTALRARLALPLLCCWWLWKSCDRSDARAWVAFVLSRFVYVRVLPAETPAGVMNEAYRALASHLASANDSALIVTRDAQGTLVSWNPLCVRALNAHTWVCVLPDAAWMLSRSKPAALLMKL